MTTTAAIGVFGGSFDPPHLAHLALARVARDTLALDAVLWVPAGAPWQKQRAGHQLAPADDRVAMIEALLAGEPGMVVDRREVDRCGPSYTVETLRELAAERPHARLWLVIGQDQYASFDTWRDWHRIVAMAGLAVAARDGQAVRAAPAVAAAPHVSRVLPLPAMAHSATAIRRLAASGAAEADLASLAGAPVARYISDHSLYRAPYPPGPQEKQP